MSLITTVSSTSYGFGVGHKKCCFTRGGNYYVVYAELDSYRKLYYKKADSMANLVSATETLLIDATAAISNRWEIHYDSVTDSLIVAYSYVINAYYANFSFDGSDNLVEDYNYQLTFSPREYDYLNITRDEDNYPIITANSINTQTLNVSVYRAANTDPTGTGSWSHTENVYATGYQYFLQDHTSLVSSGNDTYYFFMHKVNVDDPYRIKYFKISGTTTGTEVDTAVTVEFTGNGGSGGMTRPIVKDSKFYIGYSSDTKWILKMMEFDPSDDSHTEEVIDTPTGLDPTYGITQIELALSNNVLVAYTAYNVDDGVTTNDFLHIFAKNPGGWADLTTNLTGNAAFDYNPIYTIRSPETPALDELYLFTGSTDIRGFNANWVYSTDTVGFSGTPVKGDAPLSVTYTPLIGGGLT